MNIIQRPSPNFDSREGHIVDMLVMHYTGMMTAQGALEKLCNGNAERKVSAHYMVDEDGTVYALVPEEMRAWHAGVSYWRGNTNINQRSIGIEIVNPGHDYGYRPFPEKQMISVAELSQAILARHAIEPRNVVAHSDIAPERKDDPGELFDWKWLAEQNIGLWPNFNKRSSGLLHILALPLAFLPFSELLPASLKKSEKIALGALSTPEQIQRQLSHYGYNCPQTGVLDESTQKTIFAFQRHFRPKLLTGKWDRECSLLLNALLDSTC